MQSPDILRIGFSLGGLFVFWTLGLIFPFRKSQAFRDFPRWMTNLTFSFGNGLLIFLLIPISLTGLTQIKWLGGFSLLPISSFLSSPYHFFLGWLILDLSMYWQHRFSHWISWFWRLHRVHHSDMEIDTTSAGRFHTLEIFISFGIKCVLIVIFQIPAESIVFFVILLNFSALFNHSNFKIPNFIEKPLRYLLITPDIHRIHHSAIHNEMNSNFGFSISLWDRLFSTYKGEPSKDPLKMKIGLDDFRLKKDQTLLALLKQPFKE